MENNQDQKTQRVRAPWFSKMDFYYRRPPSTEEEVISESQLEHRIQFAKAAINARGESGFKDGLPISAATVQEKTKGPEPEVIIDLPGPTEQIHRTIERESEDLKRRLAQII